MTPHNRSIMKKSVLCLLAGLVAVPLGAATQALPAPALSAEYRIQVGDELDVKFFYNPDLNEHVVVRPDGRISLQLVPELIVAGESPAALTRLLTEAYSGQLRQPQVTVIVRAFGAQRVYVDGEVGKPGMVPMVGPLTMLQAVAEAGGLKNSARATEVILIRRGAGDKPSTVRVNLKSLREGRLAAQDLQLSPLDIVYVPRSRITNVNDWVDGYLRKNIPLPFGLQYGVYR